MSTLSTSGGAVPDSVEESVRSEERLTALRRYDVLDTDPEPAFDRVARLAAHLFDAPTALVNLIDEDRQWFKSTVGFDEDQTGLDASFCVFTIAKGDVLVVEDLTEDDAFADNPYVTEHGIRFYAGAPLVTPDDQRLGTVCVLDTEPRSPSEETLDRLADLAAMVVDELELRRERTEHQQSRELLRQSQQLADVGGSAYDPETEEVIWTDQTYRIFGLSPESEVDLDTAVDFYTPESRSVIEPEVERLLNEGGQYDLELDVVTADGERRHVRTIAEAQRENDETTQIVGAVQDVTEQHRDRRRKEFQNKVFEWIATGAPVDAVLDEIARFTEEELPDAAVSILRLDDSRLYHASGPSLPKDYIDAIDGVEIGPDAGTCGAAAYREREAVTRDIREDDRWDDFRAAAERAGFRSCNSQVIRESEGAILGTFAIYRAEPGGLGAEERQFVKRMSHVASVALEREQRERALRESEERYRTLVDHFPGAAFLYDEALRCTLAGGTALKQVGLTAEEVEGTTPRERYPAEIAEPLMEALQAALHGEERTLDQHYRGRDYSVHTVPIREGEACMAVSLDVTERRRRKEALERQNDLFAKAQDIADVGAWEYDLQSGELAWTDETYRIHDLSTDVDVIPERAIEFYHPDDRATIREAFERAVEAGESYDLELRLITDDGEQRWVRTRGEPQREDDEIVRVRGTIQDVTERKTSRLRLKRQREYTDHLFNAVDDLFFALDEDAHFQRWNERIPEVTGYNDEELGELTAFDLVPESEHERVAARISEALETGRAQVEVPLRRKDGTTIPYEFAGSLVKHPEEGLQIVGIGRDVTERVRRRNELEAAKEAAEEADRIKSALLSNMNHEFRTPLTSIISFSELISKEPAMAEKFADRIHGGGKRLLHTLNTVMDFAELEAESLTPTPKHVDLGTLAQSIVNAFSHQIERDGLSVQVREPEGAVAAFLDEHLVERVLAHLVSNAVKFTEEGGEVTVTVTAGEQTVTLRVADTGEGIAPDFLPHVYDQFAQASSGYDRTHEGNGLGLTIVKRMVERMEGTVSIDSTVGEGTTVTVRLPADNQPGDEPRSAVDGAS